LAERTEVKEQVSDDAPRVIETDTYRLTIGEYVEAAPDHRMPAWLEVEFFGFDEPNTWARVELRNNVPRLVEVGWRSGPGSREVMPKDLRGHDLDSIIDGLYSGFVMRVDHTARKVECALDMDSEFSREIREFLDQRRSGKRRITGAFLEQVAEVYRANIDHAPTEAVSRTFGVKHRMATDYVKQARGRGLLPPTKQGRARA
jgi:hypothetical protein